jgi:diadenosine tetraphosphate (Ap4A) HIT family hydrolase
MTSDCYACNLANGTETLIGGLIAENQWWRVEHCMGSLGTSTLILKPKRHVVDVYALSNEETQEMGLMLRESARVVTELCQCDRIYICLWSHANWEKVHIHSVVQPVWNDRRFLFSNPDPVLQTEMFSANESLDAKEVKVFCEKARKIFRIDW